MLIIVNKENKPSFTITVITVRLQDQELGSNRENGYNEYSCPSPAPGPPSATPAPAPLHPHGWLPWQPRLAPGHARRGAARCVAVSPSGPPEGPWCPRSSASTSRTSLSASGGKLKIKNLLFSYPCNILSVMCRTAPGRVDNTDTSNFFLFEQTLSSITRLMYKDSCE